MAYVLANTALGSETTNNAPLTSWIIVDGSHVELSADCMAVVFAAKYSGSGRAVDKSGNEAKLLYDGSVKLSIKKKDQSGFVVFVLLMPDWVTMPIDTAIQTDTTHTSPVDMMFANAT